MIADGDIESANATHRVDQRCVIDQVPHLRITEELGEKAGVDRECCRSSLCERCVTVVEELRHVAEQQALGEGTRGARLHVDDRDSSCLEVLEDRGQAGEVEHITQALPDRFGHDGEARVAAGHSQQMGGTLALLPEGTPLSWIATGEQEGSRRTLAKAAGEERRTADLAGDHSLDVRRVEGDEIVDALAQADELHGHAEVVLDGEVVNDKPTSYRVERGVTMVPENRRLFKRLTVLENLQLGAYLRNDKDQIEADLERIFTMFPRVKERLNQRSGTLSGGEQQMVAMGRALMASPRVLLMDEPSMGLAPALVQTNFELIQQIHQEGIAIFMVEQNANMALSIADRGWVLQTGRVVLDDSAEALLANPDLRASYLGEGNR